MADTLNNFGLAEIKTLKTANKMVLTDIDIKMPVNEIENINPEYIRAGASIFGTEGTYGVAQDSVVIPAGIYEFNQLSENEYYGSTAVPCYYMGELLINNKIASQPGMVYVYTSASEDTPVDFSHLISRLVYVPNDTEVSLAEAKQFYGCLSPYTTCKITADDTFELKDPSDASQLLIDRKTANYANTDYTFKFRTPYPEKNGGYRPCTGIRVSNTYNGAVDEICYLNTAGNEINDWLSNYSSSNNTIDFSYFTGYDNGNYIKPDCAQNIDPQVLAWIIINLNQLNPTGGVCKNCGANASKATLVCEACDKKYWIGSDVLSTPSIAYEKVMDIDDELKLYVAQCDDNTIYTSDNRHITSLNTSIPTSTSVAINTKYNTADNISSTKLTLYTSSMDDVSQVYCASSYDQVDNDCTGRDGEINIYTYTADAPFFLKSNRTLYIKGGSWNAQVQSFTYQANNLGLYEIYGDNEVLTCYGGEYWYSDFSAVDDSTGYAGYTECPYEYCAAKFYSTYDDSITNEARTCPACSNTIYFSSQYSDDLQCSATAPTVYQVFNGSSWYTTANYDHYGSQTCPNGCGATLLFETGISCENVSTSCPVCNASLIANCNGGENYDDTGFTLVGENPGVTWNTLQLDTTYNLDYTGNNSDYKYYIFTAPTSSNYTFASTSNGDPDIYAYYSESDALSGGEPAWSNSEGGGFSYTCTMADGDTIYIKVRQYSDASDTWSVSQTSSVDPVYYYCPNCDTEYYSEDDMNMCSVREGCPGYSYGISWTTMSENIDYSIPYNEWAYYIYRAPTTTSYTFVSTSNGDPDIKAFSSKSAAVNDDGTPDWSDTNSGGFSYTTNFADGDTIYIKVRQYNMDYTDTFKVKFASDSETTCPKCGSSSYMDGQCNSCFYGVYNTYCSVCEKYIDDDLSMHMANYHEYVDCANCGTYYPSYDAASTCNVQEGCPGWESGNQEDTFVCPGCDSVYGSAAERDACSHSPSCPGYDDNGSGSSQCTNCNEYYQGEYCGNCYTQCSDCNAIYLKSESHSCSSGDSGDSGDTTYYYCGTYLGDGIYCTHAGLYGETCAEDHGPCVYSSPSGDS